MSSALIKIVAFLVGCLLPAAIAAAAVAGSSTGDASARLPRKPDPVAVYAPMPEPAAMPPRSAAVDASDHAVMIDTPRRVTRPVVYRRVRTYLPSHWYGGPYYGYPVDSWGWNVGVRFGDYGHGGYGHYGRSYGHHRRHGCHGGGGRHHGYVHGGYGHYYGSNWGVGVRFRF